MNISSVVITTRPETADALAATLAALPGLQIHARTPNGRLAATLEDSALATAADTFVRLHALPGVQSVSLIFQYSE